MATGKLLGRYFPMAIFGSRGPALRFFWDARGGFFPCLRTFDADIFLKVENENAAGSRIFFLGVHMCCIKRCFFLHGQDQEGKPNCRGEGGLRVAVERRRDDERLWERRWKRRRGGGRRQEDGYKKNCMIRENVWLPTCGQKNQHKYSKNGALIN